MSCFFSTYEIRKLFYLKKVYMFLKKLYICRSITYLDNIISQVFYSINKNKTLLMSNIFCQNLGFFVLYEYTYR